MLNSRCIFLILACVFFISCTVQTPLVERLKKTNGQYESWDGNGVVYALPKLGFDVQFQVSRTYFETPECSTDLLTPEQKNAMDIEAGIKIKARTIVALHSTQFTKRAVPDPDRIFISRFPEASWWADSSLLIKMGSNGVIEGTEGSAASKAAAIGMKALEFVGNVGASVITLGVAAPHQSFGKKKCVEKADEFMRLQKEIANYRTSPTPFSKEVLDQYISEINAEQIPILALYLGEPRVVKGAASCFVVPEKFETKRIVTLYSTHGLHVERGVSCAMDKEFKAPDQFSPEQGEKVSPILMAVEPADETLTSAYAAGPSSVPDSAGFFYSVPARAYISLSGHKNAAKDRESYLLPQLGSLHTLPQVEGANPVLVVDLHEETGALKSVKVVNNAADVAGLISATDTSINTLLAATTAQKAKEDEAAIAAAAKRDPLAVLTREQALLEAELAIATAKEALKQSAP